MMYHVHMTRLIQITAYVRDEADLAKWKALGNKTAWLHERLTKPQPPKHHWSESMSKVIADDTDCKVAHALKDSAIMRGEPTITPAEEPA